MIIYSVFYLLLGLTTLKANAIPPVPSLYDVLVKNCEMLNNLNDMRDSFKSCNNFDVIKDIKNPTQESKKNVLCLHYYDTFTSFCTELKTSNLSNVKVNLLPNFNDYKVENICKNNFGLFPAKKHFEHNVHNIIKNEAMCYVFCLNLDGSLVQECVLAYYFANFNVSQLIQSKASVTQETVPDVKSEADSSKIEPESPGKQIRLSNTVSTQKQQSETNKVTNNSSVASKPSSNDEKLQKASDSDQKTGQATDLTSPTDSKNVGKAQIDSMNEDKTASSVKGISINSETQNAAVEESKVKKTVSVDEKSRNSLTPKDDQKHSPKSDTVVAYTPKQNPEESVDNEQNLKEVVADQPSDENINIEDEKVLPVDQQNNLNKEDIGAKDNVIGEDQGEDINDAYGDPEEQKEGIKIIEQKQNDKPIALTSTGDDDRPANYNTADDMDGESYFFSYFMVICVLFVLGYVGYHNRQKVMALMLEGKRGKRSTRGRRPNSANYHKLDSNLEEAISSTCTKNSSQVIY